MADVIKGDRREPYVGEKRKFLRDGYGTYVYENQYFRYEGEWMKGKKHGHGKLIMKDGTYYEGQFINGEINGNGFKYFASSKAKYTGQFLNGEMHGHGTMLYSNGNTYEGQWYKNKKQGFGILRTGERAVYEGTFHSHVKDGEGTQTYDNGDRYEGYWVLDKRQGHGDLWCADGTHYSGQFMDDMFHGEGAMTHASGIVYRGNWLNGFPITMSTKIVLLIEESPLIIRQGLPFAVRVECRNDEDELIDDQGRELQVMAGFKYRAPKEGSALFDMIEDVEEKPIPTPFYDVVPYPLTDQLNEVEVTTDSVDDSDTKTGGTRTEDEGEDKGEEEGEDEGIEDKEPAAADDVEAVAATMQGVSLSSDNLAPGEEGFPGADSQSPTPVEQPDETKGRKSEEVTPLLPPVQSKPTIHGVCEWQNLQLAPPPPMYRPFVIMEEEAGPKKKSKLAQIKERLEGEECEDEEYEDKALEEPLCNPESGPSFEPPMPEGLLMSLAPDEIDFFTDEEEKKNAAQLPPGALSKQSTESEKPATSEEKFARTGEYILIVQDVTNPPFMGRRLEPAYLMLKLKKPKRIIVKKAKRVCRYIDDVEEEEECFDIYENVTQSDSSSNTEIKKKEDEERVEKKMAKEEDEKILEKDRSRKSPQ